MLIRRWPWLLGLALLAALVPEPPAGACEPAIRGQPHPPVPEQGEVAGAPAAPELLSATELRAPSESGCGGGDECSFDRVRIVLRTDVDWIRVEGAPGARLYVPRASTQPANGVAFEFLTIELDRNPQTPRYRVAAFDAEGRTSAATPVTPI